MSTDRSTTSRAVSGWAASRFTRRQFTKTVVVSAGVVLTGQAALRAAAAQDKITLNQWYHQYGEAGVQDAVLRYAEEYTKVNPNVQVKVTWNPGDYGAKLRASLLTPEGPDVFEESLTLDLVKAGQVAPLDDVLTPELKADFNPRVIEDNSINGVTYGVKMVVDTGLLYYRKSLLEEKGVAPPTTIDELIAAAKTLSSGRVKGIFVGNDGGVGALRDVSVWSAGGDFVVNNEVVFNNEQTIAAWTKVRELNQSGALLTGAPTDWLDPSAFNQNLTAMQWGGLWAMPAIQEALGDDFGVVAWPALVAGGTPATFLGGWTQFVNAKSPNIDAAKQYVKWLWIDSVDLQKDFNLSYGFHVPPRISVAATAEPLQSGPPKDAVDILNQYARDLAPVVVPSIQAALNTALSNIVKQNADVAQEVATAAATAQQELQRALA